MALLTCKGILSAAKLGCIKFIDVKQIIESLLIEDPDENEGEVMVKVEKEEVKKDD